MAQGTRAASSVADSRTRLETVSPARGEKRERDTGAALPRTGSKRSRMAEAGAARDADEEEDHPNEPHVEDSQDGQGHAYSSKVNITDEVCPITDKNEKPFRLMDLPPEIRIEIYRACLTRPFDILLSREPKLAEVEKERSQVTEDRDSFDELIDLPEDEDHSMIVTTQDRDDSPVHTIGFRPRMRSLRSLTRNRNANNNNANNNNNMTNTLNAQDPVTPQPNATTGSRSRSVAPPRGRRTTTTTTTITSTVLPPRAPRPQDVDPLLVKLLCASKLVYKEARAILYGENNFMLDLDTAQITLAALHQRSRGQIKYLRVTIPTHNEILERFAEVVRLSLRYCWRLKRFVVHMPFVLPGAEGSSTSGNTTVYANAFDILRWLPRQCEVSLEGNVCEEIRRVVEKNSNLAKSLDEVSYNLYAKNGFDTMDT
jgi:hypothetical protein